MGPLGGAFGCRLFLWRMYSCTERVILTLRYEWLRRLPVIRGLDHLDRLLRDFGPTTLGGRGPRSEVSGWTVGSVGEVSQDTAHQPGATRLPRHPDHRVSTRRLTPPPTAVGVTSRSGASHRVFATLFQPPRCPDDSSTSHRHRHARGRPATLGGRSPSEPLRRRPKPTQRPHVHPTTTPGLTVSSVLLRSSWGSWAVGVAACLWHHRWHWRLRRPR